MDFITNNEGMVKIRIDAVGGDLDRIAFKYPTSFMNEMARQLTSAIESATGVEGIADSSVELIMMFASSTYMEHVSDNVTYRRLMLIDAVSAPRDFWVKWTRLEATDGEYNEGNILFELGEDVDQKIREREYRYLLTAGKDKYHNSMGRKKVTEWRDVIKRAAKRGELTKVESDFELAPETLELEERIADLLGKRIEARTQPAKEEVPYITPENDEFARAMEKVRLVVEAAAEEAEEPTLEEIADEISEAEAEEIPEEPIEAFPVGEGGPLAVDEVVEEPIIEEEPVGASIARPIEEPVIEEELVEEEPIEEEIIEEELVIEEPIIEEEPVGASIARPIEEPIADEPAEFDIFEDLEATDDSEPVEELEFEELDIFDEDSPAEEIPEEPIIEEPIIEEEPVGASIARPIEEPVIEEPIIEEEPVGASIARPIEEPVIEEPVIEEEPVGASIARTIEEPVIEEPIIEEEPVGASIARPIEEPVIEEPTVYEPKTQQISIADRVADIRAELEIKIRLEYETRAREKAEEELVELRRKYDQLRRESEQLRRESEEMVAEARAEQERLRLEYEHLLEMTQREAAARDAEEARRRTEEIKLREQIELQLRAEASERERLAEAARMAIEEQHRLEAENARIARQKEEEERIEAERQRKIEEEKAIEAIRQAELERIRRENEEAKAKAKNAMPEMKDGKYAYTSKTVKFVFRRSVDPNITTRIQEIIKATVDYYGKDNISLKIRASVPDSQTVILDFTNIPLEEMELLGNIIKILGNSGLGIAKAIVE